MLSNIYLHYVLDFWFEKRFAKQCRGKAFLIRFADDYIACFQYEGDAKHFNQEMRTQLSAFDLEVEPSKTALLRFDSTSLREDGTRGARTFNSLALPFTWAAVVRAALWWDGRPKVSVYARSSSC